MERTTEENPRQKKISTILAETFPTTVGSWRQTERERLYAELDDDAKTKPVVFYGLGSGQAIRQSTHPDSSNGPASSTPIAQALYHMTGRTHARQPIVKTVANRQAFLDGLAQVVDRFGWRFHAYCLMNNYYHYGYQMREIAD